MNKSRSAILTLYPFLLVVLAIEDALKGFHLEGETTGLVFLGVRQSGIANFILGPLVAAFLFFFAVSIWRMRSLAVGLAFGYAVYVTINLIAFTAINPMPTNRGDQIFGIGYSALALLLSWGVALYLRRRRADFS